MRDPSRECPDPKDKVIGAWAVGLGIWLVALLLMILLDLTRATMT